ncbi:MAG: isochorismate synthase [Acidobacteriota bacterium]
MDASLTAPTLRTPTLLERACDVQSDVLRLCLPLNRRPLELLRARKDLSVVWRSAELECVGFGETYAIEASGEERYERLESKAENLFRHLQTIHADGVDAGRPRLFGGLSFAPGTASKDAWAAFGDCRFVLPRLLLIARADGRSWIELNLGASGRDASSIARALAGAEALASTDPRLSRLPEGEGGPSADLTAEPEDLQEWTRRIEEIRHAIADGRAEKIVAAREVLAHPRRVDVPSLLAGLSEDMPACLLFGFVCGDATFLGASPERLIARQGTRIRTHALAGSIRPGTSGQGVQAATLFDSAKDRSEHRFVVDHLVERLRPWCRELSWPEEPQVQELRNVLHLDSPIVGELASPRHVLSLVAALHPTPAVGGVPAELAQRWITEREPAPRGWYSGPVGWFDDAGDGDFSVAIRSGLVSEGEVRLYSGAGIVADSEPVSEHDETELKLTPLRSLLARSEPAVD